MKDYFSIELKNNDIKYPSMISDKIVYDQNGDIHRYLSTKKVVNLTPSETMQIFNQNDVYQWDILSDPDKVFAYFSSFNKYISANIKANDQSILELYNLKDSNIQLPEYDIQLPEPEYITVTKFNSSYYEYDVYNSKYKYSFPILFMNLPFEYYSLQYIPEYIYTWDGNDFSFSNMNKNEFYELYNNIVTNGICKPLYFQISNGKLISADDEDYIILLIAIYLKIPVIPVGLYMIKNDSKSNLLICTRFIDLLNKHTNIDDSNYESINMANELCNPYFLFKNTDLKCKIASESENSYQIINLTPRDKDFYLHNSTIHENVALPDEVVETIDINRFHENANNEIKKQIESEINNLINNMK